MNPLVCFGTLSGNPVLRSRKQKCKSKHVPSFLSLSTSCYLPVNLSVEVKSVLNWASMQLWRATSLNGAFVEPFNILQECREKAFKGIQLVQNSTNVKLYV
jgi:hypothetical protein